MQRILWQFLHTHVKYMCNVYVILGTYEDNDNSDDDDGMVE